MDNNNNIQQEPEVLKDTHDHTTSATDLQGIGLYTQPSYGHMNHHNLVGGPPMQQLPTTDHLYSFTNSMSYNTPNIHNFHGFPSYNYMQGYPGGVVYDYGPQRPLSPPHTGGGLFAQHSGQRPVGPFGEIAQNPSFSLAPAPRKRTRADDIEHDSDHTESEDIDSDDSDLFVSDYAPSAKLKAHAEKGKERDIGSGAKVGPSKRRSTRHTLDQLVETAKFKRARRQEAGSPSPNPGRRSRRYSAGTQTGQAMKVKPVDDPENLLIYRLRTIHRCSWPEIVTRLNERRHKVGSSLPDFSEAAVYGRFKRNAPTIAEREGIKNFKYADWMHMKPNEAGSGHGRLGTMDVRAGRLDTLAAAAVAVGNGEANLAHASSYGDLAHLGHGLAGLASRANTSLHTTFTQEEDRILMEVYNEMKQELWQTLAREMSHRIGKDISEDDCELRFEQLHGHTK